MGSISLRQLFFRGFAGYLRGPQRSHLGETKPLGVLELLLLWQDRARQRRQLAEMSDYMLNDMGLSRSDALRESRKPFWRV